MNDNIPYGYDSEGRYNNGLPEKPSDDDDCDMDVADINDVIEVSKTIPYAVTIKTDSGHITICRGRVISRSGWASPVEYKKAMRKYHAIINNR